MNQRLKSQPSNQSIAGEGEKKHGKGQDVQEREEDLLLHMQPY